MTRMGDLYQELETKPLTYWQKWRRSVEFWFLMFWIALWLLPEAIWRKITGKKTQSDIDAENFHR